MFPFHYRGLWCLVCCWRWFCQFVLYLLIPQYNYLASWLVSTDSDTCLYQCYYYYYYYYYCYCWCCKTLSRRVWTFITTCTTAQSGILSSTRWIQPTPQRTITLRFVLLYLRLDAPNGISHPSPQCYTFHSSITVGVFWALLSSILMLQNRGSMQFSSSTPLLVNLRCCLFLFVCSLQWIICFEKSCSSVLHYQI